MNAVFYGPIKNSENDGECSVQSVAQCSSQEQQPKTRKHVLQVSTYQVSRLQMKFQTFFY